MKSHTPTIDLRALVDWKDEVTIVPFSGIQMLDFGFDASTLAVKGRFMEKTVREEGDMVERMLVPLPREMEASAEVEQTRAPTDPDPYSIDHEKALAPFVGEWVPVPVLRIRKEGGAIGTESYDPGPSSWARLRVVALDPPDPVSGHTHRVQLALDTMLESSNSPDRYIAPDRSDAENPREFRFVSDPDEIAWFLSNPQQRGADETFTDLQRWASDWIRELFLEFKTEEARENGRSFREDQLKYDFEHWARYLQFLRTIDAAVRIPKIRFLDTVSVRDSMPPVEVDLILDVGNSRTCGIFVERFPDAAQVDLTKSFPLELRDLSQPQLHYSGLVESRVEFAELNFGRDRFSSASGRGNGFLWPSFVRVGPEARRLTQSETGSETISGLSSPKRYLWDTTARRQDWRFHNHHDPNNLPRNARAIMQYINEAGDDLDEMEREMNAGLRPRKQTSMIPAIRPRFSRSSVYAFMLSELISQALVQINDPAGRSRREQGDLPRRLARIILTLPTATPVQELKIIRSRANAALAMVWKRLGIEDEASNISIKPELIVDWDEASCTQLVYLYSEITQRMDGQISDYFALKGRDRTNPATGQLAASLRMACIDVGGGTTDLMVTTYFDENNAVLRPHQTFREGFRVAGDDLVHRVISDLVLPAIARDAESQGAIGVVGKLRELFGADLGGGDMQLSQTRRQFVLRVLRPLATALISATESAEAEGTMLISPAQVLGELPVPHVTDEEVEPAKPQLAVPPQILDYLEAPLQHIGASDWSLADFALSVPRHDIDAIVRDVFQIALDNMMEIIDHVGADVILLTGRPSQLPAVRALVEEKLVVPPDRVVSMHRYRAGGWYPYRNQISQRIGDPKSTVAVGGMLIALSGSRIPNFKVWTEAYRMRSTARHIGVMDNSGRIRTANELFRPGDPRTGQKANTQARVELYNPMLIGFRQLPIERWTTTPLYQLDFANEGARNRKLPLTVVLERPEIEGEEEDMSLEKRIAIEALQEAFDVTEVFDGDGLDARASDVTLRLQTIGFQQAYWLDTGIVGR